MISRETGSIASERASALLRLCGLSVCAAVLLAACTGVDLRGEGITSDPGPVDPSLTADVPADDFGIRIVEGRRYVEARPGDTVESLAARYGAEPAALAQVNGLPLRVNLQTGRIVELPSSARPGGAAQEPPFGGATDTVRELPLESSPLADRELAVESAPLGNQEAAVEAAPAQDRISEIAALAIGGAEAQEEPAPETQPTGLPRTSEVVHIVRPGETAFSIADSYGISVQVLANWNSLTPPEYPVRLNQRLLVPQVTFETDSDAEATASAETALDSAAAGQDPAAVREAPATADAEPAATASTEPVPGIGEVQTERDFIMPVQGEIILGYSGQPGGNEGINIFAPEGTPVAASGDGTVAIVSPRTNGTTIVLIRHKEDFHTVYTNLKDVDVEKDQRVVQGQIIGSVAGGDNEFLHFEIRIGTQSTDPVPYLQGAPA